MSTFMNEVDCQYIKALFPQYLLEQPISHDLWKLYHQHRKLFNKLKVKRYIAPKDGVNFGLDCYKRSSRLTYATRKAIWEKLSQLGVLGIIPYDSATDEYLIQVYKYFYTTQAERLPSERGRKPKDSSDGSVDRIQRQQHGVNGDDDIAMEFDTHEVGPEEEEDGDEDGEEDGEDYAQSSDTLPSDSEESALGGSQVQSPEPEAGADLRGENEVDTFYPAVTESKHKLKPKPNPVSGEIYSSLNYPLPHKWVTPSNSSVLVSADGFSNVRPNPNWQVYSGYDNSPIVNNRLRTSLSNQKQHWASTWANTYVSHKKLAIFYFEIRVLSVTSSQSGQTCNINIGFKDWSKVATTSVEGNTSDPPSRDPGELSALNRQQTSNILRGTFDGSRPTSQQSGAGKDVYAYNGSDGYINDGTLFKSYSKPFGRDDVIGCGVNYVDGTIFFTKNGIHLGTAFKDVSHLDLVPFVSLKPANSIRTNFGLYEEFLFDISGYQNHWKNKAYYHIFKSVAGTDKSGFEFRKDGDDDPSSNEDEDVHMPDSAGIVQNTENSSDDELSSNFDDDDSIQLKDGFLLSRDTRFSGDKLYKPEKERLNTISNADDSIPCTLNTMINDYLIHKGLIDVAKGFLKDLQKDCIPNNSEERTRMVIRHHERQIKREEENLKTRQDIRTLIKKGDFLHCIKYIDTKFPGLLTTHIDLAFEFKVAEYLLAILNLNQNSIDLVLQKGLEISNEFIYNDRIPQDLRDRFKAHFTEISALMAYDNPLVECTKDLAIYLTPSYLEDRLFQLVNSTILEFLKMKSESSLENMISYTRAMVNTLMEYGQQQNSLGTDPERRYYKLVNIDEDLLTL
ncbi:glucose-induced degradation complex subunit VID30 Ecym_2574 [Eremothecium cymbalariae DBVPG|uniref:B30.2/SPRY domain-containing protein n=1 Tax=Eremothecium cymbalariae (strain CBS 270.75 / DBVPG 7215 / KCTC 17166 / NRRL Y-17582) TaxID=931890 RepID=G8JQF7_ERECY|nr:Hypothetical protein Ecym_2574 [Eremothecium cymbalariae DBVPG\